jgi:glycosyltransferase involved in cell wall biosynthesis
MNEPIISIVIPTYNSEKTIELTLKSIYRQNYPLNKIQIIIVDGGSSDNTLIIAKRYACLIINNPKTDIVNAELLGYKMATGNYLVGLAPDEVLENKNSLRLKYFAMSNFPNVRSVLPTGYKTPSDYSSINHYINEFGDPFSYFLYRDSKGYQYLIKDLKKRYKTIAEDNKCIIFSFSKNKKLPLIELWAGGCMIDIVYIKQNFPEIMKSPSLIPLIFYLLLDTGSYLAVTKNDPTVHYSTSSIGKYLKKIRSRVEFNVFETPMGMGGYTGRQIYEHKRVRIEKYLFIPYSLSLLFPTVDSIYLSITRKERIFLLHPLLCLYTTFLILYFYLVKALRIKHTIKLYGH